MLELLMKKWKVTKKDLFIILLVFAITGLCTAYVSRAATGWVGFTMATNWGWKVLLRLGILIFGYQAILLTVAFLLGQFSFFWQFEKKLLTRLRIIKKKAIIQK
jgi:hypothetical protein